MKKRLLLFAVLLLLLLPLSVRAAFTAEEEAKIQKVHDILYQAAWNFETGVIDLSSVLKNENDEGFYINYVLELMRTENRGTMFHISRYVHPYEPTYRYDRVQLVYKEDYTKEGYEAFKAAIYTILHDAVGYESPENPNPFDLSRLDIVLALHDAVDQWTQYDYESYFNPSTAPSYTCDPYGALVHRKCTCDGYARTYEMLLDAMGVPNEYAVGVVAGGGLHAWNLVRMEDNKWYHVDTTWDDAGTPGLTYHRYFLRSDAWMRSVDGGHTSWDIPSQITPTTAGDYLDENPGHYLFTNGTDSVNPVHRVEDKLYWFDSNHTLRKSAAQWKLSSQPVAYSQVKKVPDSPVWWWDGKLCFVASGSAGQWRAAQFDPETGEVTTLRTFPDPEVSSGIFLGATRDETTGTVALGTLKAGEYEYTLQPQVEFFLPETPLTDSGANMAPNPVNRRGEVEFYWDGAAKEATVVVAAYQENKMTGLVTRQMTLSPGVNRLIPQKGQSLPQGDSYKCFFLAPNSSLRPLAGHLHP